MIKHLRLTLNLLSFVEYLCEHYSTTLLSYHQPMGLCLVCCAAIGHGEVCCDPPESEMAERGRGMLGPRLRVSQMLMAKRRPRVIGEDEWKGLAQGRMAWLRD